MGENQQSVDVHVQYCMASNLRHGELVFTFFRSRLCSHENEFLCSNTYIEAIMAKEPGQSHGQQ